MLTVITNPDHENLSQGIGYPVRVLTVWIWTGNPLNAYQAKPIRLELLITAFIHWFMSIVHCPFDSRFPSRW